MTDALRAKIAALTFKTSEITAGEAIAWTKAQRETDVAAWLQFIAMRVEQNETFGVIKPSDLWDVGLSQLVELTKRASSAIEAGKAITNAIDKMRVH